MSGVVVVGGGLGGLRVSESLRASGYSGPITVVGDEPYLPYNRPPLSKEALRGRIDEVGRRSLLWLLLLSAALAVIAVGAADTAVDHSLAVAHREAFLARLKGQA